MATDSAATGKGGWTWKRWALLAFGVAMIGAILMDCAEDPAIKAVRKTVTGASSTALSYEAGPLAAGTAVLASGQGAYYVVGSTVYTANGTAMSWSPGAPVSDNPGISFATVKAAVARAQ